MPSTDRKMPCHIAFFCLVWVACVQLAPSAWCQPLWNEDEQRFSVGLKLFPAALGALESLEERRNEAGALEILVVHAGGDDLAREAAQHLIRLGSIRDLPLSVRTIDRDALDRGAHPPPAGIFVASVGMRGEWLRRWSERTGGLVFSPFAGDVEAGAIAGVHVSDRILPAVNLTQARRAGLVFKPFFLKVARVHE